QVLQRAGGGERAVDERAAPSLRGQLAPDDDLTAVDLEQRLNCCRVLAGSHTLARRAATEQQADGFDEDRLARAGFTRQDVEAGVEIDLEPLDDGQVFDAQIPQHGEKAGECREGDPGY